jgi:beta-N-acetylhexosaminidase
MSTTPPGAVSSAPRPQSPKPTPTPIPACTPAPLERQAAATLVVGLPDTTSPDDPLAISMPALGVGGIFLDRDNVQSAGQVRDLIAAIKARRGAPLVIAADEEGGRVTTFSSVFGWQPSARDSAALGPKALRTRAAALARQMKAFGVTLDFAPDLDVTAGPWDGPIGDRSYSGDPATVAADGLAVARGLSEGGITPVIKHFPGLGEADLDTHVTAPVIDAPPWVLLFRDMLPFYGAIKAGAPVVMVGHAEYPALGTEGLPASLSPTIYDRLRLLGFRGVTFTDSLGMGAVNLRYDFPAAAVKALAAGADALLTTDGNQARRMRDAIVTAVRAHLLPASRLADAAARVTALAGGDAYALTCRHVTLPALH